MNDPLRLHDAGTAEERLLIARGRDDEPPNGAVARALSALGVAGAVAVAPAAAQAASLSAASAAGASAASAGGSSTFTALTLAKWLGIGALGGTLTAAVATAPTWSTSVKPVPRVMPAAAGAASSAAGPTAPRHVHAKAPLTAETPSSSAPPASPPARDSLGEELGLLERARGALARGRADEARAALGRHREQFASGALAEEAAVLRIEVALTHGEVELGKQAARDFLSAHPS
ncbi:MAG TPA: hypothetical protein VFZ53_23660, partial [Polyangiaceae bacterium]